MPWMAEVGFLQTKFPLNNVAMSMNQTKSYRSSFILLTLLFFLWGFITVLVDSLIPRLRELFTLNFFLV